MSTDKEINEPKVAVEYLPPGNSHIGKGSQSKGGMCLIICVILV